MRKDLDKQDQALCEELRRRFRAADEDIQPPVSLAPCMIVRKLEREGDAARSRRGWTSGRLSRLVSRRAMAAVLSAALVLGGTAGVWLAGRRQTDGPVETGNAFASLFQPDLSTGKRNSYYDIYLALEQIRRRQDRTRAVDEAALQAGDSGLQSCLPVRLAAGPQIDRMTSELEDALTTSETSSEPTCQPGPPGPQEPDFSGSVPDAGSTGSGTGSDVIGNDASPSRPPASKVSQPTAASHYSPSVSDFSLGAANGAQTDDVYAPSSGSAASKKPGGASSAPQDAASESETMGGEDWDTSELAAFRTQVPMVDEADVVQTDGSHLYILSRSAGDRRLLSIVKTEGGQMELLSSIPVGFTGEAEIELYVSGNQLIALGNQDESLGGMAADGIAKAEFYDISDRSQPVLTRIWKQQGLMSGSRLIDGTLYITTTPYYPYIPGINEELAKNYLPRFWDSGSGKINPLHPGQVQIVEDTDTASYCFVAAVDLAGGGQVLAALGGGDVLYSNAEHLYIAAVRQKEGATFSEVLRFTMGYNMRYTGRGRLPGAITDSLRMDAKDGYLRAVTQFPHSGGSGLYILDDGLAIVGSLEGIAPGQDIRSVRFEGDTAYLAVSGDEGAVLVADLEDPTRPVLSGSTSMPGFTGMLYPVEDGRMLSVEEEDARLVLRLFDVSDPGRPSQLATYTVQAADGMRLSSEAVCKHHAVTYLSQRQLCFIPLTAESGFSGILALSLAGNGLQPRGLITTARAANHTLYEVEKGDWARRTVVMDDVGFAVADGAVMAFDLATLQDGLSLRLYDSSVKIVSFSGVDRTPILSASGS